MTIKNFILFSFLFLFLKTCFSQDFDSKSWIGTWEGSYKVTGGEFPGTAKEILTISTEHNRKYLHFTVKGWMANDSNMNWTEDYFMTIDLSTRSFIGFYIDDNGADYLESLSGLLIGDNKINLKGECKRYTTNDTLEIKQDGKLYKTDLTKYKDNGEKYSMNAVFIKQK